MSPEKYHKSDNYFQGTEENHTHLSVGAVLVDPKTGKIACHHAFEVRDLRDVYTLMRETIEPNETIESAIDRGLMEEFGAKGEIKKFLGSLVSTFLRADFPVQKTTIYFLYELTSFDPNKRMSGHDEWDSVIEWQDADFLIDAMERQSKFSDLDESEILFEYKRYLNALS